MAIVVLPAPSRPYASGRRNVSVAGKSVREGLSDLLRQHPALSGHLFSEEGALRPFVHLFLDGEEIPQGMEADTILREGSRLLVVPSIAGGQGGRPRVWLFRPQELPVGPRGPRSVMPTA